MYDWVEDGLVESPRAEGAVLMLFSSWAAVPGLPLLRWLLERPKVTAELFTRIFTVPGVSGASLTQCDEGAGDHPIRTIVVPGLIKARVWDRDFVVQAVESALRNDLPSYQNRWFEKLARDLEVRS